MAEASFSSLVVYRPPSVETGHVYLLFDDRRQNNERMQEMLDDLGLNSENDSDQKTSENLTDNLNTRISLIVELNDDNLESFTMYELLGLKEIGFQADQETIRLAYRKAALMYHPDKSRQRYSNLVFIAIQKAYDTLGNIDKRRAYDSSLPINDDIPDDIEEGKDFFTTYSPVFREISRFAIVKPVPDLGDSESSLFSVKEFYRYWTRFDSWRDWSSVAMSELDCDVENASNRSERRWMMMDVTKLVNKKKREELGKIARLVEVCLARDPRLRAANEANELKKKKKKMNVSKTKTRIKLDDDDEKNKIAARWSYLSQLLSCVPNLEPEAKSRIESSLACDLTKINDLVVRLGGSRDRLDARCYEICHAWLHDDDAVVRPDDDDDADTTTSAASNSSSSVSTEWTREELSCLSTAVTRIPSGTRQRWVEINKLLIHLLNKMGITNCTKTPKACADMYTKITRREAVVSVKIDWSQDEQSRLEDGLRQYKDGDRWTMIARLVATKDGQQCQDRFNELKAALKAKKSKAK